MPKPPPVGRSGGRRPGRPDAPRVRRTPPPRRPRRTEPPRQTSSRARQIALGALAAGVAAIVGLVVVTLVGGGEDEHTAAQRLDTFLADWSRGADALAARSTDAPARALAALRANRAGLDGARLRAAKLGDVREAGGSASARMRLTWEVPGIGPWSYTAGIRLVEAPSGEWLVHWAPTVVHPRLRAGARLGTVREPQERGRILDRDGEPLVEARPVKRVGVVAGRVEDPAAAAAAIAAAVDIDPAPFERRIRGGGPEQFVEAITLRPEDYALVEAEVTAIPGAEVVDGTAQLAPSRTFGRQVLGDVRELSAEQLRRLGAAYAVGDAGGQSGLQAAYERQLAGTPTRAIVIRVDGVPTRRLLVRRGRPAEDLQTTLDVATQAAAEQALDDNLGDETETKAALVALEPSSGDVLAVANRPADELFDRALEGQYPPGSTFKIVTTDALLSARAVTPETIVDCPTTVNVGGREFKNFEGGGGGEEPFSRAFAESCNTAFVAFAPRLAPDALTLAGERFGLGVELDQVGLPAYGGQVPEPRDLVARAAAMIGQDRVLASPLGMAGVIATVADGSWRPPRLVDAAEGDDPAAEPADEGVPLDPASAEQLRALTREVVTSGTGTALAYVSGEAHGKSGTAEHGRGDPPPTHAWFVAYRDDVAVAVLVEGGAAGGEVAAPIAASFFTALDAGVTPE